MNPQSQLPLTYTVNGKTYYAGTQWVLTPSEVPIGNATPWMTGGISNTFRYKDFSLYVLADAKLGGDTYFGTYAAAMGNGLLQETVKERNGGGVPLVYPDGTRQIQVSCSMAYSLTASKIPMWLRLPGIT